MGMSKRAIDPARLEGEALDRWYRRTPDEIAEEHRMAEQDRHDEFFGELAFLEPPLRPPVTRAPVRPAPLRPGLAEPQGAPRKGDEGDYFGSFGPLPGGGEYVTHAPAPLNQIEPSFVGGDRYVLSDGSIVSGDEVERIYAEQKRRIRGDDDAEPKRYARKVDRLRDGRIPLASQLEQGEWEKDPTCHPDGGWEPDPRYAGRPEHTRRYETQISRAPGLEYVVRTAGRDPVRFDGCAVWDPRHQLLEAKGPGYDDLFDAGVKYKFFGSVADKAKDQGQRQSRVAGGRPIDWHVAEKHARRVFGDALEKFPMRVLHTPPVRRGLW
jgi:hypothetical protein